MPMESYKMIQDRLRNKKTIAIILSMIIIGILALTGCFNNKTTNGPHRKDTSSKNKTIAVVNQDVGVEYSGKTINYSEEFIKTLDDNTFKLVSSTDAEEGVKNGTYAGTIVFPGSLSASILNINYKNPQAINIEYSINKKANKIDASVTQDRISDVYQTFNNKLSYAYINALMEEIELGQYNVTEIFNNDGSNLAAARKLADGNYNVDFKAPVMPEKMPEFEEQNTDEYQSSGHTYVDQVDRLFRAAYTSAHKNVSDEINTDVNIKAVDDSVETMTSVLNSIAKYIDDTADFNNKYDIYVDDVEDYQKKVVEYEEAVADYQEKVDAYINIQNPTAEHLQNVQNAKKNVEQKKVEANKAGEKIKGKSPSFPYEASLPTKDDVESSGNAIKNAVAIYQNKLKSLAARLAPDKMIKSAMDEPGVSKTYKEKIDEVRNSFIKDAKDTSNRFNKIQSENRSKLDEAYSLNSKFMFDTVKVLNETNLKDHKALGESVQSFLKTAEANSKDTRTRLNAFQGMLSRAKVNGRFSSDVMKFLIRPIQLVEKNTVN